MIAARRILPAVLVLLAVIGAFRLRIDVDILNLLPSDSPVARGLTEYQENFLQAGELIIVVRSGAADTTLNAVTSIVARARSRADLVDRVFWQPPANESLADAAKFVSYLWLNDSTNAVIELQARLSATNLSAVLEQTRERIATTFNPSDLFLLPRDPLNLSLISSEAPESASAPERFFSSEDGRTRLIYAYAAVPLGDYRQCHAWVAEMRALVKSATAILKSDFRIGSNNAPGLAGARPSGGLAGARPSGGFAGDRPSGGFAGDRPSGGFAGDRPSGVRGAEIYFESRSSPEVHQILFTGRPMFVDEISSGMRDDMSTAVPGTLLLIGVLFYALHREWISLALLLATLFIVMVWAALAGSAIIGQLNVISVGFASILLGLAEDFGIVLHQELKNHPGGDAAMIRRMAGPGIFWSALTTASAFALLNLSALPGLRNLGTLVALGIVIGAWAMLYVFLPMLIRWRTVRATQAGEGFARSGIVTGSRWPRVATGLAFLACAGALLTNPPAFDSSPDVLRPRKSEASEALRIVQETIGASGDPYWLLVHGSSVQEVRSNLEILDAHLTSTAAGAGIDDHTLPLAVWPNPVAQQANVPALQALAREEERISAAVLSNGFAPEALEFSSTVFAEWERFRATEPNWPSGRIADWVLPKFVAKEGTNLMALGVITPGAAFDREKVVPPELEDAVLLSGWKLLGRDVLRQVQRETPVIAGMVGLMVVCALWFTFRNAWPVFLSLAVLGFSGIVLLAVMGLMGWRWNLLNLTALPLLLGMGIDYSIHMQTALQRFGGDASGAFQSVGRALLLAGSTTIIGFAFLGMSSNAGMASLGRVCAMGLAILLLTSVFLLPGWVRRTIFTTERDSRELVPPGR